MEQILECVPNFSEGRNKKKIAKIVNSIRKIKRIFLLNVCSDYDHNRSVITFAGEPNAVIKAAFEATKTAAKIINLNKHQGVHPRIGATDVIPLVPISGIKIDEAIKYAKELARDIARKLKIPTYLYEKSATNTKYKNLSNIRNHGYENLKTEILKNKEFKPDYGPKKLGSAGATAIGVRDILIAYNINLDTNNLVIARKIAKKIRFSSGGLNYVKAKGLALKSRKIVQISMNLTNYKKTGLYKVFKAVEKETKKYNCKILESEIIGLIPEKALLKTGKNYKKILKLTKNFSKKQILEVALNKIR